MAKLKAKQSIGLGSRKYARAGEEFEITDAAEAKRLVDIGAAEQIMVPADDSKIEDSAKTEDKPAAAPQGRPALTRRG